MGSGSGNSTGQALNPPSPLRRDTVLIPANSWLVLRFITDNREQSFLSWNYVMHSTHVLAPVLATIQSGLMGVPLPHCVAYGGWAINANQ